MEILISIFSQLSSLKRSYNAHFFRKDTQNKKKVN